MKKRNITLVIFFLLSIFKSYAQDIIRTKKDTIKAKVMEIGIDEIKYHDFNNPDGPVIVIPKTDVIEITYANGSKFLIAPDAYDANQEVEIRNKTRCIKFEIFSPLTNDLAFGYETMLKVGTNLEFKLAVIGPGLSPNTENASGFFFKGGVKFLKSPDYYQKGAKYSHALKGGYIKPELIFNTYSVNRNINTNYQSYYSPTFVNVKYTNIAFDIVFGKQLILGNVMTFDYYVGVGYGIQTSNKNSNSPYDYSESTYSYSHEYFGKNFPMIITGGMTLGVLF